MVDIINDDRGPFQKLFGDDASLDPMIVLPIAFAVFVVLMIIAIRILLKDKGKSEMNEQELEKDRALLDARMQKDAEYRGAEYKPELAREAERKEIAEANRRYGKPKNKKE